MGTIEKGKNFYQADIYPKIATFKIIRNLLILVFLLTPLFGFWEYLGYLGYFPYTRQEVLTPWYVKGLKDFILLIIYGITIITIMVERKIIKLPLILFFFYLWVLTLFCISFVDNYIFAIIGLRSIYTLFLVYISFYFLTSKDLDVIFKIMVIVAILVIPLVGIQVLYGIPIYGKILNQFAARPTGVFVQPSSLGIFMVTVLLFLTFSSNFRRLKFVLIPIIGFVVLLTASGTAFFSLVFVLLLILLKVKMNIYLKAAFITITMAFLIGFIYFSFSYLPLISGRPDIWNSPLGRIGVLANYISDMSLKDLLIGKGFGYGSNSAFTILPTVSYNSDMSRYAFIPDSLYISLFSQLGLIGLFFFLVFNVSVFLKSNHPFRITIPVFLFMGVTVNILEFFPLNWVYPILLGICLKYRRT